MNKYLWMFLLLALTANAFARYVAVLETYADSAAREEVSRSDRTYLTNVLREEAVKVLPAEQNYTIMTRENINAMLPPGKTIEECEGSCLAETGKNISADYVCQATVGKFGGFLTLTAELYETAGNKLVASFNGRGVNVIELLELVKQRAPAFFGKVAPAPEAPKDTVVDSLPKADTDSVPLVTADSIPLATVDTLQKADADSALDVASTAATQAAEDAANDKGEASAKGGIHWIPLSISAAVAVAGGVLAVIGNLQAKEAYEDGFDSYEEDEKNKHKAHKGQILRGIGIGVAAVGVVGIGLSFVF